MLSVNGKWIRKVLLVILCLTVVSGAWADRFRQDKLIPTDPGSQGSFGASVCINGDYAIVGADFYADDNWKDIGSAHVFKRDGTTWNQQAQLLASDGEDDSYFGCSVSIRGDYAIVGAKEDNNENGVEAGSAYLFERSDIPGDPNWHEQEKLLASDGGESDHFGRSVSISGDYAIVGAPDARNGSGWSGSAYVFYYSGAILVQYPKLVASDGASQDYFGLSVSISGDYAIVGSPGDDDNGDSSGSAYIFKRVGATWSEQTKLLALDGASQDYFGFSVSISGDYAIVGTSWDGTTAYIFKRDGTTWNQQAKLIASDGKQGNSFGRSVSISGDYAIVGARYDDDNGLDSGSAYLFKREGTTWGQHAKLLPSDGDEDDNFGCSVSVSGDQILVGARGDEGFFNSGAAYVFKKCPHGDLNGDCFVDLADVAVVANQWLQGKQPECFDHSDCPADEYCIHPGTVDAQCVECESASECPYDGDFYCEGGLINAYTCASGQCKHWGVECPQDMVCVDGDCVDTCCVEHPEPGCSNPSIESCVCAIQAYCCTDEWDSNCVAEAQLSCGSCY